MTIREIIRYGFECELCSFTDEPRYTLGGALTDEEAHMTTMHPSWVAEREHRKRRAEVPTQPIMIDGIERGKL